MKSFAIVAVLLAAVIAVNAVTDEQKAKAAEHVKACTVEAGVTDAELAAAKSNPNLDTKDKKLQKFATCFFNKAGFLNDKGEFNEKATIEKLSAGEDKAKVEGLVNLCKKDAGTNKDEIPLRLYKCYVQHKAL